MKYLLLLLLLLPNISIHSLGQDKYPKAKKGILDLRKYDLEKKKTIKLDGAWEFVYDDWLLSKQLNKIKQKSYIEVPNVWNGLEWKGKKLAGQGIATYHLKILLKDTQKLLALKIPAPSSAYNLYINDRLKIKQGKIATNYQATKASSENRVLSIPNPSDTLEITIHIANFHHRKGGIWFSLDFGIDSDIYELRQKNFLFDVFLLGSLLIMACYYLVFFILRKKDVTSIYFSLFCFTVLVRILSVGEKFIFLLIPTLSWEFTIKLEYISFYLASSAATMIIQSLYSKEYKLWIKKIVVIHSFGASLITIVTPSIIHSNLVPYFQIFVMMLGLYTIAVLVLASIRKREGALIFVGGFFIIVVTIINDILHYSYIINTFDALPLGVFIFFFAQSVVLSKRFSRTFTTVENLTDNLKELNQNLEKKVEERTQEVIEQKKQIETQHRDLVEINQDITSSMNYAQRIQESILPEEDKMKEYFKDIFIFYRPRDIVSGDFYWFSRPTQDLAIIAAVDCTGHGIPGGFMSMIGNDLLEEIINIRNIYEPDKILQELKKRINEVLKQKDTGNQDGMDISICTIRYYSKHSKDTPTKAKLSYSGANSTVIYFQNETLGKLKADRIMIGGYNPLEKESIFTSQSIDLDQKTRVYLFSDGYQDQFGGIYKRKFMRTRFRDLLSKIHQETMEKQKEILEQTFLDWTKSHKQIDDILVIGLEL